MFVTLDGKVIDYKTVPIVNIPIWNYDTTFRAKEIIIERGLLVHGLDILMTGRQRRS